MKRLIAVLVLLSCAMPTLANIATIKGATIQKTLLQEGSFGGCMISLDKSIKDAGLSCPDSNWVSLDCDGAYSSKAAAQRMLDSAQLAFVMNKEVFILVDDSKKHNDYCVATRIIILK
jgi:hypothetical protein